MSYQTQSLFIPLLLSLCICLFFSLVHVHHTLSLENNTIAFSR